VAESKDKEEERKKERKKDISSEMFANSHLL
jgi:hypothetical protein